MLMKPELVAYAYTNRSMASKMGVVSPQQIVKLCKHVALESSNRRRRRGRLKGFTPLRLV